MSSGSEAARAGSAPGGLLESEPEHIALSKSKGLKIDWKDRHTSEYGLQELRDACPCASCTGAHGTTPLRDVRERAQADPFQLYKPALKIESAQPVGHYAIQINWNDGHNSGIYSFEYLRQICSCPDCRRRRARSV